MSEVLIIEDDPNILLGIELALEEEGFDMITASDGMVGYALAKKKNPDMIILDLMLPNKNGFEICRNLREQNFNMPILMLTSKKEESDRIEGFECGADDYVTKPFSIKELVMRVRALLRRSAPRMDEGGYFDFSDIRVEYKKLDAFRDGKSIGLTAKEYQILKYFIEHEGEVISRNQMLDDIWGYDAFPTTRTVDNYILSIRKKIERNPSQPAHLLTVPTVGYKFLK